jgi:molybdopterin molybdotransferase
MSKRADVQIQPNCEDGFEPTLLSVELAIEQIAALVEPLSDIETVPLRNALGRVLAEDLRSPVDVPNHTNAAMDGYAICSTDLSRPNLTVIGTAWAGRAFDGTLEPGQCARIMTGAVMPNGSDTVIMQEQVERNDDTIRIAPGQSPGQHVRQAGEDLASGSIALLSGQRLFPAELGITASLGISELRVLRKPRVAFFSNGDELRSIREPLSLGEVYDSNRYTLHGMLTRAGAELIDFGVVPDDRALLQNTFESAAAISDLVITSAGASVGDADYVHEILNQIGEVGFWKIAMKPGRPLSVGKIGSTLFFGLPGNPVSVMVTFYQFVLPALRKLAGEQTISSFRCSARVTSQLKKKPGRTEFQRGYLTLSDDGELTVKHTGEQGSGILSSMSRANCFVILPADSYGADIGDTVTVEPFAGLI